MGGASTIQATTWSWPCSSSITPCAPWGAAGPTPQERWSSRQAITQEQRDQFRQCLRQMRWQVLDEQGLYEDELLSRNARATVVRESIRRAMESLGYLLVQRKRISPPFNSPLRDKIR